MNGLTQNLISFTKSLVLGFREIKNIRLSSFRKVFSLMGKNEKMALWLLFASAIIAFVFSIRNFVYSHTTLVPANGGNYTEGFVGQPLYVNPLLASQDPDNSLVKLVFSGLYKYDNSGELVPDIADGMPQISDDQKQYTINLKRNVTWHNGKSLTADDIIFTVQVLKDPTFKSPLRPLWESTTVEKLSDYSVKFSVSNVSGPFINNLILPILPKSIWQNVDSSNFLLSKYNLEAIGSGPYAIKEIKKLPSGKVEQISLGTNTNFYLGRGKIDQIILKFYDNEEDLLNAFHSREISGFGFTPLGSSLYMEKNQSDAEILTIPLPQYQVVFFNLNNKVLNEQPVRQALTLATNRQEIIDKVFKSNALLPVSPLVFNDPKNPKTIISETNIEEAKKILDQAGWTVDEQNGIRTKKGQQLKISISTNDSLVNSQAMELLANQWKILNIQVSFNVLPSKQLMDTVIKPRNFEVLLFPQKFGADPDPFLFWHSSQTKNPGYNLTGFTDNAADKLIVDARATTDKQKRAEAYEQFNTLVSSKYPVIFLDQTEFKYALDKSVKNVSLQNLYDPSYRFYDITNWYVKMQRSWGK